MCGKISSHCFGHSTLGRLLSAMLAVASVVVGALGVTADAYAQAKSDIVVVTGTELRTQVSAALLGQALTRSGIGVNYKTLPVAEWPSALASGDVHVAAEVPLASVADDYASAIADGQVKDLGFRQSKGADPKYKKLVWAGARKRWTSAVKLTKNMTLSESDIQGVMVTVREDGHSVEQAVEHWMDANKPRWSKWLSASKNWMKP